MHGIFDSLCCWDTKGALIYINALEVTPNTPRDLEAAESCKRFQTKDKPEYPRF